MPDEFDNFDELDPEPQAEPQTQTEPQYVPREDFESLRYGVAQLAHYLAAQQNQEPSEPQAVPELRLAVNPQTGAWEPVQEQAAPIDPAEAARQAAMEAIAPYQPMLAASREQAVNQQVAQAFATVKANGVEFDEQEAYEQAELLAATGQVSNFADAIKGGISRAMLRDQQRRQAWEAERSEHLDKLASGRQEPPASGSASPAGEVPTGADAYHRNQEAFFAAKGQLRSVV
jgi:hypothetical protein